MAWPGGKDGAGVVQRLINQIPPHEVFVSAFLGDCALLRRKRPAAANVGIDLDRANIERWATRGPPVVASLELYCCDSIEWLRHRFGWYRVAMFGGCGRENLVRSHHPATAAAVAGNGGDVCRRRRTSPETAAADPDAECGCVAGRVAGIGGAMDSGAEGNWFDPSVFVYADPPYLMGSRRTAKRLYAHELSDDRHVELLATLKGLPCLAMVSHYPCDLYDTELAGWRSFTFDAQTRGGARAVEKVWCNYPPPDKLHDARYLGLDKRQRERVRRRVKNWTAGLARMEPLERQAVLDAISSTVGP